MAERDMAHMVAREGSIREKGEMAAMEESSAGMVVEEVIAMIALRVGTDTEATAAPEQS